MALNSKLKEEGITLVAMIITIIVLIILAVVTIRGLIDMNIIKLATDSTVKYAEKQQEELNEFDELANELEEELAKLNNSLPDNTKETEAGIEVKLPNQWYSTSPAYVSTEDGSIVKKIVQVASVTAVAVGNGETVPVPGGFYYVGGTISSGVVISDDVRDRNKYAGIEDVPAGAIYNDDGTVKSYSDDEYNKLSDDEKKAIILGNQFVWIPVSISEYKKVNWGMAASNWEKSTRTAELPQIQKYEGFYIGRYESGTSKISLSTGVNFTSPNSGSNNNNKFSIRDGLGHTASGNIVTKPGEIPYYYTDYYTALKLSSNMYSTKYVQSGLVTGTMWDVAINFIAGGDNSIAKSSDWGNYSNGNVKYTVGKGRYISPATTGAITSSFTKSDGKYHFGIKTTGISEDVKKKNIYDLAGNLWEWTEEAFYISSAIEGYTVRGGSYYQKYAEYPVCYRSYATETNYCAVNYGFRPVLYIK